MEVEIGQLVYVVDKEIFVRVIDKKSIDGIMIYYTDDSLAYVIEQLHYLRKKEQELEYDEIKNLISEWLTPDKALETNVRISKAIAKPLGYELERKLKKERA